MRRSPGTSIATAEGARAAVATIASVRRSVFPLVGIETSFAILESGCEMASCGSAASRMKSAYAFPMPDLDLAKAVLVARRAVEAASAASLVHYERGVRVEVKPDSTPVTQADRDSEAAILRVVRESFPDHGFLGEESGAHPG